MKCESTCMQNVVLRISFAHDETVRVLTRAMVTLECFNASVDKTDFDKFIFAEVEQ